MRAKPMTALVTALAALLALAAAAHAVGTEPNAVGLWQATDEESGQPTGWFLIKDHDGVYDGIIAKMFLQPGQDPSVACVQCRDDRHDKPWLGLEIIRGMKQEGLKYEDGSILDPRDGNVYSAMMTLTPDGQTLVVRGYLGISLLGRNQYWKRLPDSAYSQLDPTINPKHAARARKPEPASKPENSARR
jgi:Uncharacterized protein conserved in bacteria (DUF2147)